MFNLYNANWSTNENKYFGLSYDGESGLYIRKEYNGNFNGYVGIGTTSPQEKLEVVGNIHLSGLANNKIKFDRPSDGSTVGAVGWDSDNSFYLAGHPATGPNAGNDVRLYGFGGDLLLGNSTLGDVFTMDGTTGNIGIGTTIPNATLEVAGSARVTDLSGTGNRMVITNSSGDLSSQAIPVNTDNQTLSYNSGTGLLTISGGNNVSLSSLGGDNLGNHIASQNLTLNYMWMSNDGNSEGLNIDNSGHVKTSGHLTIDNFLYMDDYSNGNSTTNIQASAIGRNGSFVFYSGGVYVGQLGSTSSVNVGTGDIHT